MSTRNEGTKTRTSFEFALAHEDVVNLMNDANVNLNDRNVDAEQVFQIYVQKENGSQIFLREFKPTDKVMFKFVVIEDVDDDADFDNIDVS